MNENIYENAEIVSIPELSNQYQVKLDERYYKIYSKKSNGTISNFFVLESFFIKVLFKNNDNIIDKGTSRIKNIKETELAQTLQIDSYKNCYYTDENISKLYFIDGTNYIYGKLRQGNFNTICFNLE